MTPTYNRRYLIGRSVDSALAWLRTGNIVGEVVVVDDASTDDTVAHLRDVYGTEIRDGQVRIIALPHNEGVTGAKNAGIQAARGDWLIFLDSDDAIISQTAPEILAALAVAGGIGALFVRAQDMDTGEHIGRPLNGVVDAGWKDFQNNWLGDCLPIVPRAVMKAHPYEARLRGYEGIVWLRILKYVAPIRILPTIALRVSRGLEDRLSRGGTPLNCNHARGSWLILTEFWRQMPPLHMLRVSQFVVRAALSCAWQRIRSR